MVPHVLLVGGGHTSVAVIRQARHWVRAGARVTLLSEHRHLFYSGMVPEMVGGVYRPEEARIDLEALCHRSDVRWMQGKAVHVHPSRRIVTTADSQTIAADVIAFNTGSGTHAADQAPEAIPTKPLNRMEVAAEVAREAARGNHRSVVVVGGGAAGVELSLNLTARGGEHLDLTLVEPRHRLLTEFSVSLGKKARRVLEERGATVLLNTLATGTAEGQVLLDDGASLSADAIIWAAGPSAPALFAESGLPTDQAGYLLVERTLQVPGYPWLFGAGDCATVIGYESLKKVGVHAVKQGPVLAENLERVIAGRLRRMLPLEGDLARFSPYPVAPLILSTGGREGWLAAGRISLRGESMLRAKHVADLRWMKKYRSLPRFRSPTAVLHVKSASHLDA